MHLNTIAFSAFLATAALAWEEGVDCTTGQIGNTTPGLFSVFDAEGIDVLCDDLNELGTTVSTGNDYSCYMTHDNDDTLGDKVKCPGDDAPGKNPDGTAAERIADGFIETWCDAASGGLAFDFVSLTGCLLYGYYSAAGDPVAENEAGALAVCDTMFAGACTWFIDMAPSLAEGMSRPCVDDPNSNACAFANPGK